MHVKLPLWTEKNGDVKGIVSDDDRVTDVNENCPVLVRDRNEHSGLLDSIVMVRLIRDADPVVMEMMGFGVSSGGVEMVTLCWL